MCNVSEECSGGMGRAGRRNGEMVQMRVLLVQIEPCTFFLSNMRWKERPPEKGRHQGKTGSSLRAMWSSRQVNPPSTESMWTASPSGVKFRILFSSSLSFSLSLSLSPSLPPSLSLCLCLSVCVCLSLSLSLSHTHTLLKWVDC